MVTFLFYFHFNPCPLGTDNGLVVGTDKIIISLKINLYSATLPLVPKQVMISVKNVRNRGEVAAKYEILTVSSNLLVRRTRKTRRGTTRKLYPRAELVEDRRWSALTSGILKRIPAKMMV